MAATEVTMSDSEQFFEGVEKLLEIWFTAGDGTAKTADLRKIPRLVRCLLFFFIALGWFAGGFLGVRDRQFGRHWFFHMRERAISWRLSNFILYHFNLMLLFFFSTTHTVGFVFTSFVDIVNGYVIFGCYFWHWRFFDFNCFRHKLESLLKIVRCEIISFVKNDQIDAYVLRWVLFFIFIS